MIINTNWHKCHGEGWTGIITPESFAHPAKFSRALIRRIYSHAIKRGYIAPGAVCIDPFGGVALGALHAMQNGLHWVGVELEEKFIVLGRGMDCPGFDVTFYRRYQQRGAKWLNLGVCPECARALDDHVPFETFFGTVTRKIPHRSAHRYGGNIGKWESEFDLPGTATLLQGDSQRLVEVLGAAGLVVSSPPYSNEALGSKGGEGPRTTSAPHTKPGTKQSNSYGDHPAQLSAMSLGKPPVVIGSPPWEQSLSRDRVDKADRVALARELGISVDQVSAIDMENVGQRKQEYGATLCQMGDMPSGDLAAVLSSPVYPGCLHGRGGIDTDKLRDGDNPPGPNSQVLIMNDYGQAPAQLAEMVLGSPPHIDSLGDGKSGIDWSKQADRDTGHPHGWDGENYGQLSSQLGGMKTGDVQAVIGSPPHLNTLASDDPDKRGGLFRDPKRRDDKTLTAEYGKSPGQMGAMRAGALVESPPFEKTLGKGGETKGFHSHDENAAYNRCKRDYVEPISNGQLGQEKGDTFWQAAHTIMSQCYQILAPGSVAIWVLKAFVRNKAIVDFPGQWQQLGEACGFETVEVIRAWLIEDRGAQWDLFGELHERQVERKSFFRIIYEKKARAAKHWESVPRNEKARHLWEAHTVLWERYECELANPHTENDPPRPPMKVILSRTISSAQMAAYVEAGKPDIEIDTAIDFEIVLIQRRPWNGEPHPSAVTR